MQYLNDYLIDQDVFMQFVELIKNHWYFVPAATNAQRRAVSPAVYE